MLYLQIAESIATPIRAGTLARGERIPSVRELARRCRVSLGTVLQAYRMLEDSRLIVIAPGTMFSATHHFRHCIRLGLGGNWDDAHRRALRRVGSLAATLQQRASAVTLTS
jgi:DNA-binding transcriptional MocR family regulator